MLEILEMLATTATKKGATKEDATKKVAMKNVAIKKDPMKKDATHRSARHILWRAPKSTGRNFLTITEKLSRTSKEHDNFYKVVFRLLYAETC